MNTYLFAWNPTKWSWTDLAQNIESLNQTGRVIQKWSCVSHKQVRLGDRAFLVRLGTEPKGIMGSGTIISEAFLSEHWSGEDKLVHRVFIEFDTLLNPMKEPILSLEALDIGKLSRQVWTPQASGISIKPDVTNELEAIWFNFLNDREPEETIADDAASDSYFEGATRAVISTNRERNPHARAACLRHYGYKCIVCEFDFEKVYGEAGREFIHVHHLSEVANKKGVYKIDPIEDLRPVCPNCHSIIHRRKPAYSIAEMKDMIQGNSFK
ncbi:5-methylcytosine-specific restriction enzyme A [Cyclonatronum proteinivorum]|uniref:5-methylcytosine-specific restriction enzyme A n=1 Tax=Cyclonatronum proteinivorum TaxID=1457365 RepID=A0A345UGS0_9BACT|nr:HNH endonuclease [Cyclonatronum proteinivorum]AXI99671.1 5-methylcytosine-specific restriction enzyme A [Cyclonatronum proteinivorum]